MWTHITSVGPQSLEDCSPACGDSSFKEFEARPAELERLRTEVDLDLKVANAWVDSKPWITEKERLDVVAKVRDRLGRS